MGKQSVKGLTVEIGGDTTRLDKALNANRSVAKGLQTELKFVDKALKFNPNNVDMVKQKTVLLKQSIENTKDKIMAMKQAQAEADRMMQQGIEVDQKEYRQLQREIAFAENSLNNYTEQLHAHTSKLKELSEKTTAIGEATYSAGQKMTKVSGVIVGAGAAAVKSGSDFEDAIAKVSTIADASVPIEDLQKAILNLSNETGVASEDIANNVYDAISAGQKTGDAVNFVSNATKLAKAGFTDTASSLDVLTTILNAYGMEAGEVTKVSDMLIQTQNLGKTTVADLASSMGKVIPTAKSANVGLEQLAAAYSITTAKGIATAESTTYINGMLNELNKSSTGVAQILKKETGKSFSELMASGKSLADVLKIVEDGAKKQGKSFNDVWSSSEAAKAGVTLLSDGVKAYNDRAKEMINSSGATDDAFKKLDTNSTKAKKSLNQLKNSFIQLGQTILQMLQPAIDKATKKVKEFTDWFNKLDESKKQFIVMIAGIIASIGPLLMILGKTIIMMGNVMDAMSKLSLGFMKLKLKMQMLTPQFVALKTSIMTSLMSAFTALKTTMISVLTPAITVVKTAVMGLNATLMANPIILIIAAIAAVIAILVALYMKCEWFRNGVNAIFESIKNFFINAWNSIVNFFTQGIPNFISTVQNWLQQLPNLINNILSSIKNFFVNAWNSIVNFFTQGIPNFISKIQNWLQQLPYKIGYLIGVILGHIINFGVKATRWIATNVPKFVSSVINFIKELPSKIWSVLVSAFNKVVSWGAKMITKAISIGTIFAKNVINFIKNLPSNLWNLLVTAYTKVTNWGSKMIAKAKSVAVTFAKNFVSFIKNLPSNLWNLLVTAVTKVAEFGKNLAKKGIEAAKNLKDAIIDGVKSLPGKMKEIGANIIEGVWKGIKGMKDKITKNVKNFFSGIVDGVKDTLEIHSPSRVAEKQLGEMFAEGVIKGVKNKYAKAKKTTSQLATLIYETAKEKLDTYKKYNNMSLAAEVAYWEKVVSSTKKGTQGYKDAMLEYKTVRNDLNSQLKTLEDDYASKVSEVKSKLISDIQAVTDKYDEAVKSRADSITSSMSLFEEFSSATERSSQDLINNLQSQVDGLTEWYLLLNNLESRNVDKSFLEELQNMGVSSLGDLRSIVAMDDTTLTQYIDLWKQKNDIATARAVQEFADYKTECEKEIKALTESANKELNTLEKEYNSTLKALGVVTQDKSVAIGKDFVKGLKNGIASKREELMNYLTEFVNSITSTAQNALNTFNAIKSAGSSVSNIVDNLSYKTALPALATEGDTTNVTTVNNKVTINTQTVDKNNIADICREINKRLGDQY